MAESPVGYRVIAGSERRPTRGAQRLGPADPNEKLSATIRVRRRPGAPPVPDQSYWAAIPPGQRQFLTRDELVAQTSATQADLDRVTAFARSQGLEVLETSAARRTVRVSGTVAQANQAFAVDLGRYQSPEESYRGREGPVHVPNEVADVIEGVFGLDNRRMARRTGTVVPPGAAPTTPPQVAKLYDFPPLNAAGQTIGILEFGGGFAQSDLNQFCAGLTPPITAPVVTVLDENGNPIPPPTYDNTSDGEVALDVQIVASVAQGANIVVFFAPTSSDGWINAVTSAIYNSPSRLTALSISWGKSEEHWDSNTMWQLDTAFAEAAYLGMTVFGASGDWGSNNLENDGQPHVFFPASDSWVTACGGTYLGVATKPPSEGTWNDWADITLPPPTPVQQVGGATGGGISGGGLTAAQPPTQSGGGTSFTAPSWQNGLTATPVTGKPIPLVTTGRGVPDVAGNASPFTPYGNLVLYGKGFVAGGTSAVAPLYASLIAIIAAKAGWPPGYLNPILYAIGGTKGQTAIKAINDGSNNALNVSFAVGGSAPPNACTSYLATAGPTALWNACTGLGRIDGNNLLKALIPQEQELTRPFNPNIPFSFGAGGEWLYHNFGTGSQSSGDGVSAGQINTANIYDTTIVQNNSPNNAVLAADNLSGGNGAVGLYGRSQGSTWSIGVAGVSPTGCGVYGIAGGSPGSTGPNGIGVAGRAMGGLATEFLPLEEVVGAPIGVLGHSANGPGVRGHGGVLLKQPQAGQTLPAARADPGGVFSSGRLRDQGISYIFPTSAPQTVGLDSLPQLRLVPSVASVRVNDVVKVTLPATAQVGDLYLVVPAQPTAGFFGTAQLYICSAVVPAPGDVANPAGPRWQLVQLGPLLRGGPV